MHLAKADRRSSRILTVWKEEEDIKYSPQQTRRRQGGDFNELLTPHLTRSCWEDPCSPHLISRPLLGWEDDKTNASWARRPRKPPRLSSKRTFH